MILLAVAFVGVYLALAGDLGAHELVLGTGAAVAAAIYARLVARCGARRLSWRADWGRAILGSLVRVPYDCVTVGACLLRVIVQPPRKSIGRFLVQKLRHGRDDPRDATRRGLTTLALSLAPNGFVLRVPRDRDALVLHQLVPTPPPADPVRPA